MKTFIFENKLTNKEILLLAINEKDAWDKLALKTADLKHSYYDASEWMLLGGQG